MQKGLLVMAVLAATVSNGLAQSNGEPSRFNKGSASRIEHVCWGERLVKCKAFTPAGWPKDSITTFKQCGPGLFTGGQAIRGWNSDIISNDLCDTKFGRHCGVYTKAEWSLSGGYCGYRLATVVCYP
jgi:hypothetical protein